jgi:hypothetical protein
LTKNVGGADIVGQSCENSRPKTQRRVDDRREIAVKVKEGSSRFFPTFVAKVAIASEHTVERKALEDEESDGRVERERPGRDAHPMYRPRYLLRDAEPDSTQGWTRPTRDDERYSLGIFENPTIGAGEGGGGPSMTLIVYRLHRGHLPNAGLAGSSGTTRPTSRPALMAW